MQQQVSNRSFWLIFDPSGNRCGWDLLDELVRGTYHYQAAAMKAFDMLFIIALSHCDGQIDLKLATLFVIIGCNWN